MPRWYILRTLLHKEVLRHLANRAGIIFLLMLIAASMLVSFFHGGVTAASGLTSEVRRCYIDFWEDSPLVEHLRRNVPVELADRIVFRLASEMHTDENGVIIYPQNTGAIQLRPLPGERAGFKAWFWHPGEDSLAIAPFEAWFWKETLAYFQQTRKTVATNQMPDKNVGPTKMPERSPDILVGHSGKGLSSLSSPIIESERSTLKGGLGPRSSLATAIVLFGVYFVCVYLLPSLTCEERERGVLLAQALSPATMREILIAKFLFYTVLALVLAAILAGAYRPLALSRPFFWLALVVSVLGSIAIGLTIASLARTQRSASMGAMSYMLVIALVLMICQQFSIPALSFLTLEYHGPCMLHAVLTDSVQWSHWGNLAGSAGLAIAWTAMAMILFRRFGWQ